VKSTAAAVGLLFAFTLAGCGGGDPKTSPDPTAPPSTLPASVGTLQGRLMMVGGPVANTSTPVPGKLTIEGNGSTVHADIGEDGRFEIQLAVGAYQISATSPKYNNGKGTCFTSPPVKVLAAGKTVTADVLCQIK
jgi:hypothetical protein